MNDTKLKLAMAKLLPEKIQATHFEEDSEPTFIWLDKVGNYANDGNGNSATVRETEWLYVMHLVRKDLTQEQKVKYLNFLRDFFSKATGVKVVSDYDLLDAEFNFQATAMCKVKGIEV